MQKSFLLLILLFLAACGAETEVTDVPFYTVTPRPLGDIPSRNLDFAGTDIPLDFAGGEPQVVQGIGSFNFSITGAFIAEANTGTVVYSQIPSSGAVPARQQLYLAANTANATQQITFEFSPNLALGRYNLVRPEDFILGLVSARYQRLVSRDTGVALESYSQNINGFLELTEVGTVISGNFQFAASFVENSDAGELQSRSIEIIGSFESVPYISSGTDPFEIIVPLPTRIFSGTPVPITTGQP